jgi:hypothetical protein
MRSRARSAPPMWSAVRGDEDPVVVELKTSFSLSLFHQAIERQAITDIVYIAVPRGTGRAGQKALAANRVALPPARAWG